MDFSLKIYNKLLTNLKERQYRFLTFKEYMDKRNELAGIPVCIIRHDVDKLPLNSLVTATIENKIGIQGTYYFRMIPAVYHEDVISRIAQMGHEIGYHYETMDTSNGNIEEAYREFCENLNRFRQVYPIETVCMHGSPRSRYDNRQIWTVYDYHKLGISGEPYYDIDFSEFAYFTDTGRRWNGSSVSVRDKVDSVYKFNFRSTYEIINNTDKLPLKIMFTIHPQRWFNPGIGWLRELIYQNVKNIAKYYFARKSLQS